MASESTLAAEKVGQNLKCMDYHQIKTVINSIDFTISNHCLEKVEIVQISSVYTHLLTFYLALFLKVKYQ